MVTVAAIRAIIDARKETILAVNRYIWEHPELFFRETQSASCLSAALRQEGFAVRENLGGIATAFVAEYGQGGPVMGMLGEYDALPSLSQQAGHHEPRPLVAGGPGHGCGHNALGAGAFAAAVAVKTYLQEHNLPGTVRFYGCPAEEAGWSKMFLARDGFFNDLAGAVTWHPHQVNTVQGASSLANICAYFRFTGKTAHAAAAPQLGRSALDACELMNVGVNYLREHVISGARMHYAYQDVGGDAPNVVQDHACLKYFIRAPRIHDAKEITERVKDVARGAALMTGTSVDIQVTAGMCDYVPNDALGRVYEQALLEVGPPRFDAADKTLASRFYDAFSAEDKATGAKVNAEVYPNAEELAGVPLIEAIAPYARIVSQNMGSTDVGDVSYATPTVQLNIASYASGTPLHSWQLTAQSGSGIAEKALLCAAEVMALGTLRAMQQPHVLDAARAEYVKVTGGAYVCPVGDDATPMY